MSLEQKTLEPQRIKGFMYLPGFTEGILLRERRFLEYIDLRFHPSLVFYPGSGVDQAPREIFGKERCIYTTLDDSPFYFEKDPPDIIADYRFNPFRDQSFDFMYVHNSPHQSLMEVVSEFDRVLKPNGLLGVVSNGDVSLFNEFIRKLVDQNGFADITTNQFRGQHYQYFTQQVEGHSTRISKYIYDRLLEQGEHVVMNAHTIALLRKNSQ